LRSRDKRQHKPVTSRCCCVIVGSVALLHLRAHSPAVLKRKTRHWRTSGGLRTLNFASTSVVKVRRLAAVLFRQLAGFQRQTCLFGRRQRCRWLLNHFTVPVFIRVISLANMSLGRAKGAAKQSRFFGKSSVRRACRGKAKSFGRNSIRNIWWVRPRCASAGRSISV
jgi:hypothetical protein